MQFLDLRGREIAHRVLPCFMAAREPELVRVLPSVARLIRSYWLVTHSDVRDLARVRAAMEFITKCVQEEGGVVLSSGIVGAK